MDNNWLDLLQSKNQTEMVLKTNEYIHQFGLIISAEEAELIITERKKVLKEEQRVEFAESIVPKLIYEFSDSRYIDQNNYISTLISLQNIFYLYKNEMMDEISDDELICFMKEQYETICYGDLDYLEGTCLHVFAEAIRAGYQGYQLEQGGEYEAFDEVPRWDYELYHKVLSEFVE